MGHIKTEDGEVMKPLNWLLALILTLIICAGLAQHNLNVHEDVRALSVQMKVLETKIDGIEVNAHSTIAIPETLANDLYDIFQESQSRADYIEGFNKIWEEKYDLAGHQSRYMGR